jgi:hypothetical protein
MMRIEVRDYANHPEVLAEGITDKVISVKMQPGGRIAIGPSAGPSDGRIYVVIPSEYELMDVTLNKPRDLMMITIQKKREG